MDRSDTTQSAQVSGSVCCPPYPVRRFAPSDKAEAKRHVSLAPFKGHFYGSFVLFVLLSLQGLIFGPLFSARIAGSKAQPSHHLASAQWKEIHSNTERCRKVSTGLWNEPAACWTSMPRNSCRMYASCRVCMDALSFLFHSGISP